MWNMKQNNETVLAEETSIESECASVNIIHHTQYANHDERCVILKESKYESVVQIPNGVGYDDNIPYALSVSFIFFFLCSIGMFGVISIQQRLHLQLFRHRFSKLSC